MRPVHMTRRRILRSTFGAASVLLLSACGQQSAPSAPTAAPTTAGAPPTPAPTAPPAPTATTAPVATPTTSAAPTATPASAATTGTGGHLTAAITGEPKFDPYFQTAPLVFINEQLFGRLFDYNGPDLTTIRPQLAESYQEMDKTLTVKVRQGVKFHNGRELVAQDVVDNIARAKDKSIGHTIYDTFNSSVDSAEAVDKYTVKITYLQPYPVKLDDLATLYLIPKEAMADLNTKPIGSGPFKFDSYASGDRVELSRFADYWEKGKPTLDQITLKIIPDAQARLANLQGGSVDIITNLPLSDAAQQKSAGQIQVIASPPQGAWYATLLNCGHKPLDNQQVRQALNYSMDRAKINKLAYFDMVPGTQTRYLPETSWYDAKANTRYTFDLKKAKDLITAAGYPNGFKTSIVVGDAVVPGSKAMAQIWAQDLAQIGVQMDLVEREQGPFYDEYFKSNFDIQAYILGDGKLDPLTYILDDSPLRLTKNTCKIDSQPFFDTYSKLVTQASSTLDPAQRKTLSDQIQELMADQGWVLISAFFVVYVGVAKKVKGFGFPLDQVYPLENVSIAPA